MKDRLPSSNDIIYTTPHHHLGSVISAPNNHNASKKEADVSISTSAIHSKLCDHQNKVVLNTKGIGAFPLPLSLPYLEQHQKLQQSQQQQRQQRTYNINNGTKNSNNCISQHNLAYCDGISENGSNTRLDLSLQSLISGETS
ncbi:hypothetical protein DITRI_Ditri02bG0180300 [Diplodiscus trichospermus]